MGLCFPCLKNSSTDQVTPDLETRRKQTMEAAERRMREQENRGIKNPEKFKYQQQKREELERRQIEADKNYHGDSGLRWQVD